MILFYISARNKHLQPSANIGYSIDHLTPQAPSPPSAQAFPPARTRTATPTRPIPNYSSPTPAIPAKKEKKDVHHDHDDEQHHKHLPINNNPNPNPHGNISQQPHLLHPNIQLPSPDKASSSSFFFFRRGSPTPPSPAPTRGKNGIPEKTAGIVYTVTRGSK